MTTCSFGTISERDMDLLFMEAIITDKEYTRFIMANTDLPTEEFKVLDVELSKTELDLGESDITVIVEIAGRRYGLLIEDKIDAPAMDEQYERYIKRGNVAVERGDYEEYRIFMFAPDKYKSNTEAKKYNYFISYEEHMEYFFDKDDLISRVRYFQLDAAINKAKSPSNVTLNKDANAFFVEYKNYQKKHYPSLDLRTTEKANGYWAEYATGFGKVVIFHKIQEGFVDLTFYNDAELLDTYRNMAQWLRNTNTQNAMNKVIALTTGKSSTLRIKVPALNMTEPFEKTSEDDLATCLEAVLELNELAQFLRMSRMINRKY